MNYYDSNMTIQTFLLKKFLDFHELVDKYSIARFSLFYWILAGAEYLQ